MSLWQATAESSRSIYWSSSILNTAYEGRRPWGEPCQSGNRNLEYSIRILRAHLLTLRSIILLFLPPWTGFLLYLSLLELVVGQYDKNRWRNPPLNLVPLVRWTGLNSDAWTTSRERIEDINLIPKARSLLMRLVPHELRAVYWRRPNREFRVSLTGAVSK